MSSVHKKPRNYMMTKKINNSVVKVRLFDEKENKIYTYALSVCENSKIYSEKIDFFFFTRAFFSKIDFLRSKLRSIFVSTLHLRKELIDFHNSFIVVPYK